MKIPDQRKGPRVFPLRRGVFAMLAPAVLTPLALLSLGVFASRPSVHELLLLPVAALMYAWPGSVIGLLFGLPTAYWLFQRRQTGLIIYVVAGAVYTMAPLIVAQALLRPNHEKFLQMVPTFALIGLVNGALAKVILFGWR